MSALDRTMRPRLHQDVRFVECPDGAYVHGDHGTCTLRGRTAYAWLSRLAPALDGNRTVAELTAGLDPERRAVAEQVIAGLARQRFVADARDALRHGLSEQERRVYSAEIDFVGYVLDSPEHRFERVRRTRTALVGDGPLATALLEACLGIGVRELVVRTRGGADGSRAAALAEVAERARRDAGQQVRFEAPSDALPDADLVLQVSQDPESLVAMWRRCAAAGIALGQALVRPAEMWLSPVGAPSVTDAGSGWLRWEALAGARSARSGIAGGGEVGEVAAPNGLGSGADDSDANWLGGPVPTVVAGVLAFACFSHLTGMDALPSGQDTPPTRSALTRVDLRNLDTRTHRHLPHPAAVLRAETEVCERLARLAAAEPLAVATVVERATELIDARLGVLESLDEGDLPQSPLAVCRATVSDPYAARRSATPAPLPEAVGWGEERADARLRALLAAVAGYGGLAARTPGVWWTWGVELHSGRPRRVRLESARTAGGYVRLPRGAGAGLSWDEAVAAGLRSQLESVYGADCPDGEEISLTDVPDDYLRRLLAVTREPVRILRLKTPGISAFSLAIAGRKAIVSSGPTEAHALSDGFERLLLGWQTGRHHELAASSPRSFGPVPGGAEGADPYGVQVMAACLRDAGRIPVVVPLDHDPAVTRLLPFAAEVVLCDGSAP
ncbi:MAG: hypothetical protein HOV87_16090 [Catenulispora sp.]|nr:hypothetical protein [Catenulispora sp.]